MNHTPLQGDTAGGAAAPPAERSFLWHHTLILAAAMMGVIAAQEIATALEGSQGLPDTVGMILVQWIGTILCGLPLIALGLALGEREGLRLKLVAQPTPPGWRRWRHALAVLHWVQLFNLVVMMGYLVIRMGRGPHLSSDVPEGASSWWEAITLSAYAGVVEEIIFRLILLGVFLCLCRAIGLRKPFIFWTANFLVAALFALSHTIGYPQPLYEQILPEVLGARVTAGLVLGWLARKEGLEIAILAHWEWDLVLSLIFLLFPPVV